MVNEKFSQKFWLKFSLTKLYVTIYFDDYFLRQPIFLFKAYHCFFRRKIIINIDLKHLMYKKMPTLISPSFYVPLFEMTKLAKYILKTCKITIKIHAFVFKNECKTLKSAQNLWLNFSPTKQVEISWPKFSQPKFSYPNFLCTKLFVLKVVGLASVGW